MVAGRMLSTMIVVSLTTASVSQEVRMAVEPQGNVVQNPAPAHEPLVRVGNYGMSESMAQRSVAGFTSNPFADLDHIDERIKRALKKKREMELVHKSRKDDSKKAFEDMINKLKTELDHAKGLEVSDWEEKKARRHLTEVQCQGAERNLTCHFKNLYFEAGANPQWHVLAIKGDDIPDLTGLTFASKYGGPAPISVYKFEDNLEAAMFVKHTKPKQHKGLTLIYSAIWHQNMGHALWDGLYPAYTALVQWGRQTESFRSVVDHNSECYQANTENGRCMSEGVFKTFGQGSFTSYQDLAAHKHPWHIFDDVVAGSGNKGARVINKDYSFPNGNVNNTLRSFRDRMYWTHGLTPPQARTHSHLNRGGPRSYRGVIIHNYKFSRNEKVMLTSLSTAVGSMGTSFSEEDGTTRALNLQYVDYGDLSHFKKHLELISHTDVHMSAVGTPACLAPLLPDGSVHVNLGNNEWPGGQEVLVQGKPQPYSQGSGASYVEEYWSEGVPYIRAIYYDHKTQHLGLKRREMQNLAQKAVKLIKSNFSMPVAAGENLSPVGKTFKEYCYSDAEACEYALNIMNGEVHNEKNAATLKECQTYGWAEMAVFEVGAFSEEGHNGQYCHLKNIEKLREIREQHVNGAATTA